MLNLISIEVFESPLVDLEAFTQIGDVSLHPTDVDAVILGPSILFRQITAPTVVKNKINGGFSYVSP